jgi:hypothetical protein
MVVRNSVTYPHSALTVFFWFYLHSSEFCPATRARLLSIELSALVSCFQVPNLFFFIVVLRCSDFDLLSFCFGCTFQIFLLAQISDLLFLGPVYNELNNLTIKNCLINSLNKIDLNVIK